MIVGTLSLSDFTKINTFSKISEASHQNGIKLLIDELKIERMHDIRSPPPRLRYDPIFLINKKNLTLSPPLESLLFPICGGGFVANRLA